MVNENNLYWFIKYLTGKGIVPYADCDIVKFKVKLLNGRFYVSDVVLNKTYGKGSLYDSKLKSIQYYCKGYSILAERKYVPLFKDCDELSIVYYVSEEANCLENINNTLILKPINDILNIEEYRKNVILNGSKYSLKGANIASYLGESIFRILSFEECRGFIIQEDLEGNILLNPEGKLEKRFSVSELEKSLYYNDCSVCKLVADLLSKMSDLPRSNDVEIFEVKNGCNMLYKVSYWRPKVKLNMQVWGHDNNKSEFIQLAK